MKCGIEEKNWKNIYEFLCTKKGLHTSAEDTIRRFIEAIWYMVRSGIQWRLLPSKYGSWRSVHKRFKRWQKAGIWKEIMDNFVDADMEWVMMDSTIVRAHSSCTGFYQEREALGKSKGGFTTKIHILADALGNPLKFILTAGQRNDITQAITLIETIKNSSVLADKGYDSNDVIEHLKKNNCKIVIPPRANRKEKRLYDKVLYQERNVIERLIGKMKHFRRIACRFDKSASSFLAFLYFVGALIWLR